MSAKSRPYTFDQRSRCAECMSEKSPLYFVEDKGSYPCTGMLRCHKCLYGSDAPRAAT